MNPTASETGFPVSRFTTPYTRKPTNPENRIMRVTKNFSAFGQDFRPGGIVTDRRLSPLVEKGFLDRLPAQTDEQRFKDELVNLIDYVSENRLTISDPRTAPLKELILKSVEAQDFSTLILAGKMAKRIVIDIEENEAAFSPPIFDDNLSTDTMTLPSPSSTKDDTDNTASLAFSEVA